MFLRRKIAKLFKKTSQLIWIERTQIIVIYAVCKPVIFWFVSVDGFCDACCSAPIPVFCNNLYMGFGFSDIAKPPINLGSLLSEISEAFFKFRHFSFGTILVPLLILAEYAANAGFQRVTFLMATAKKIDAERA